jgi:hypothetical protein
LGVVRNGQMGLLISSGQPKAACRFAQQRCERARRTRDPQFPLALPTALISRVASSKAFLLLHLHLVVHYRPSISISTSRQTVAWKLGAWCFVANGRATQEHEKRCDDPSIHATPARRASYQHHHRRLAPGSCYCLHITYVFPLHLPPNPVPWSLLDHQARYPALPPRSLSTEDRVHERISTHKTQPHFLSSPSPCTAVARRHPANPPLESPADPFLV